MKSYSLKQLFGGFILLLVFVTLFVVTVTYNSPMLNISMFINPILIVVAICMLIYVFKLNELIKLKKASLNKKDIFKLENCPKDFKEKIEVTTINNVKFTNKICESDVYGSFYLDGDKNACGEGNINDENGCFNKYSSRIKKCEKIKKYFEDRDKEILKNWVEYTNNCE